MIGSTIRCEKCWDTGLLLNESGIVRCSCPLGAWSACRFGLEQQPAPKVQIEYLQTPQSIARLVVWFCMGVIVGIGITNC